MSMTVITTLPGKRTAAPVRKAGKKRKMSQRRFFQVLAGSSEWLDWYLDTQDRIRARRLNKKGLGFCPVTAVAYLELGIKFEMCNYKTAAENLGLSRRFTEQVVAGADFPGLKNLKNRPSLRKKLLRTLNPAEK